MDRKPFQDRFNGLKREAETWLSAWKDIQKYLCPTRGNFDETPNNGKKIDHTTILNGHATRALNTLASGMTSGLTSPSRPWFKLGLPDTDLAAASSVRLWLDRVQSLMYAVFAKSNVYGSLNGMYSELGSFGTAGAILLEDFEDVIRMRTFTAGEYHLGTGPDGRVNSLSRLHPMTVGQAVADFGLDVMSQRVKSLYEQHQTEQWVKVYCLIEPNDTRIPGRMNFEGMPWRSVYWEEGGLPDSFLRRSGFRDFPILAPRWDTPTTSVTYGRGPGWDALGDIKQLQKMEKDKLIGLDKVVDPPVYADASVDGAINTFPGGVTRSSSSVPNPGVRPTYEVRIDFAALESTITRTERAISSAFFTDLFLMLANDTGGKMTAREVVERHEEKMLLLGPVLERLESELLKPLINRTFNILLRSGLIPPPPPEMEGLELKVEFVSILAQAQKMVGIAGIEQTVAFLGTLAAGYPSVGDNLDPDETLREYADLTGVSPRILRSREAVEALRQQRQEAEAQAKQIQDAGVAIEGAKVLADTKLGQNTALDALLSGGAAGGIR